MYFDNFYYFFLILLSFLLNSLSPQQTHSYFHVFDAIHLVYLGLYDHGKEVIYYYLLEHEQLNGAPSDENNSFLSSNFYLPVGTQGGGGSSQIPSLYIMEC